MCQGQVPIDCLKQRKKTWQYLTLATHTSLSTHYSYWHLEPHTGDLYHNCGIPSFSSACLYANYGTVLWHRPWLVFHSLPFIIHNQKPSNGT
jgi:hypothetical protein